MKKFTLLFLILFSATFAFAQVSINENFYFTPSGWTGTFYNTFIRACSVKSYEDQFSFPTPTGNLTSPNQVGASNGTDLSLSFDYKIIGSAGATSGEWGTAVLEYSTDNGSNWITVFTIDNSNHVVANTCATISATVPGANLAMGSDVKVRVLVTWANGTYNFVIDNFIAQQVITTPPNCDANLISHNNGDTDVPIAGSLAWNNASGGVTGYNVTVGTTTGASDVYSESLGNVNSISVGPLAQGTLYFVNIVPINANGSAQGCTEYSLTTITTCSVPNALTATMITDTTADLAWTENGTAALWDIELVDVTAMGAPTGTATVTGVANPYIATGLIANNDYAFYVRADCGVEDGTSAWAGPFAFTTLDTCNSPSGLNASTITGTTADLNWTENGTATVWNIELVDITASGTTTGTATSSGVSNPFNLTGLKTTNDYEFYVQSDCAVNGTSAWIGPFAFTTNCGLIAPYSEDFETFTTGSSAFVSGNCWTGTGGAYYWESAPGTDTGISNSGPSPVITTGNYFYTEATAGISGDVTDLVSPLVDLTALTAPALTFSYHMFGNDMGTLDILVNGTTNVWTLSGEQQTSETTPWSVATIDLEDYVGQTISVTFRATSAGTFHGNIAIDNLTFNELLTCPEPSVLTVSNIDLFSADLSWTENGASTLSQWNIELVDVTAAGAPTGTPTATGVTNPFNITGLTHTNNYEFYVQSDCTGSGASAWIGPFAFKTACQAFVAPYTENFETFTTGSSAFVSGNCWTGTGGAYYWKSVPGTDIGAGNTGPSPTITTGNYFLTDAGAGTSGDVTDLVSPLVDLTALTAPALTFSYHMFGEDIGTLDILVNGTTNVWTLSGEQQASETTAWDIAEVDLSAYVGQTISVTFRATKAGTTVWGNIAIDNLTFGELPTCPGPSVLTTSNIDLFSADLGWTENGAATQWNIELVDITAAGVPTGTPTETGVTNPFNITGLTHTNNYEFYVQADCTANDTSAWIGPFAFTTACQAFVAPYTENFETFTTGDFAFVSGNCWTGNGAPYYWESAPGTDTGSVGTGPSPTITAGNYFYTEASYGVSGDVTDLVSPLVDLSALTTPALTFSYHMFGNEIGTLDILVNGITNVWTLSGEQQASETTAWDIAEVDLSAYAGQTISVTFRATSATSVSTFGGDISIDNVSFTELPSCPFPTTLTATIVTDTTADLGWTENGTSTAWDIELVDITAAGIATGTPTASGVTSPYAATGLTQNNDYALYVRSDCGGATFSAWAGPFNFSTLETCPTPSGLNTISITDTTANLVWTENGAATVWNIELVNITAGGTATGTATTTTGVMSPYTATGLVVENNYEFYIQADCGIEDGISAWAGPFAFATVYVPVPPDCTNGTFMDSGGPNGDYSANENITYTISPDFTGHFVSVDFTAFSTENIGASACYDGLTIHDGPDATATTINPPGGGTIWCWDRDDTVPGGTGDLQGMMITSTHPSGALTFVFTSDSIIHRDGWEATVTCSPPEPANDDCADASPVTLGTEFSGDTTNATDSAIGIANAICSMTGGNQDVWYSFVAPLSTTVALATTADFVVIYDACGGSEVACLANGEQSPVLIAGNTYYVRIYNSGFAKVAGPFTATLSEASLSTQDFNNELGFSYYPNPIKNTLTVNAQLAITNIIVFNMLGQEVIRTEPKAVSNDLDMSNLQSGPYFVQVTIGATVETVRVIKN